MNRYLASYIDKVCFAHGKIALVSGPRQAGKTTLAKNLIAQRKTGSYFNWDQDAFRVKWLSNPESLVGPYRGMIPKALVVLDEIHKDRVWKRRLKGLYDTNTDSIDLLVTGSARLNIYRKGGDSLVGRAFHFLLHPLSISEVLGKPFAMPEEFMASLERDSFAESDPIAGEVLTNFMTYGTFPEPYFKRDPAFLAVWRRARIAQILQEDVRDLSTVHDLVKIELLYDLVRERVGSLVGKASLRETLESSFGSINRWLDILSALFLTFEVSPFSKKISRSLRREKKLYLWEISGIAAEGARFENLIALHLLKACHLWSDLGLGKFELHFVRTKEKTEIDFLITKDRTPWLPVEVKLSDAAPATSWRKLLPALECTQALQLVAAPNIHRVLQEDGRRLTIRSAAEVLAALG